ncbi:hypothetical protein JCM12298_04880 [Desulfothermus naphthae]
MKHPSNIIEEIINKKGGREKFALIRLWKNWEEVLGKNLSQLARPIGTKGKTVIIGVEDSILMQELSFYSPEILKRINQFLGKELFDKIIYKLLEDKTCLVDIVLKKETKKRRSKILIPENVGHLKETIPQESPVYKAYIKYLECIEKIKKQQEEYYNE